MSEITNFLAEENKKQKDNKAAKRYNKKLKEVAEKCDIKQNLTSYVSRHSFATQAMMQEIPINAISSMLGHSSLKTNTNLPQKFA